MCIKIIQPKNDGNRIYDNTGSVSQLVTYLHHEASERGEEEAIFFDQKTTLFQVKRS